MKILLDENLPVKIKYQINKIHEVYTVHDMRWNGVLNGKLLELLEENHFDVMITGDKKIKFQQNLEIYRPKIIILMAPNNRISTLMPYITKLNRLLEGQIKDRITEIKL